MLDQAERELIRQRLKPLIEKLNLLLTKSTGDFSAAEQLIASEFQDNTEYQKYARYLLKHEIARSTPVAHDEPTVVWNRVNEGDFRNPRKLAVRKGRAQLYLVDSNHADISMFFKYLRCDEQLKDSIKIASTLAELRRFNVFRDPNVVDVYEAGWVRVEDGSVHPFVATEYLEGIDLGDWRAKQAPTRIESAEATRVMAATLQRMIDAQNDDKARKTFGGSGPAKLMHLDLKPDNIMVLNCEDGSSGRLNETSLKLIDFGSAGTAETATAAATDGYKAPERYIDASSRPKPSPTWDIFSLGGVLYFLCTGQDPMFVNGCTKEQWNEWLKTLDLGESDLTLICRKCLAYDSKDRYESPSQLAEDLAALLSDHPLPHVGRSYTWFEREQLLISRCWKRDEIKDHSLFISQILIVGASCSAMATVIYFISLGLGSSSEFAFNVSGWLLNGAVVLLACTASAITRLQSSSRRMFMPLLALVAAVVLNGWVLTPDKMLEPTSAELDRCLLYNLPLYAVLSITIGSVTSSWGFFRYLGVIFLLLSPLHRLMLDEPSLQAYSLPFLSACEILFSLCFAAYGFSIANAPKEASGRIGS